MRSALPCAARRRPETDRRGGRVAGIVVALSVGARDRRVAAVAEYYGGLPEWEDLDLTRLPPVLILHGDADRNVRVQEAYKLEQALRESGVSCEMHIYAGQATGFAAKTVTTRSNAPSNSSTRM